MPPKRRTREAEKKVLVATKALLPAATTEPKAMIVCHNYYVFTGHSVAVDFKKSMGIAKTTKSYCVRVKRKAIGN